MLARSILTVTGILAAMPALAGELRPEEARHFIAGKHFSYTCFEGTSGSGRINADGSVVGTIQVRGAGQPRFVVLPAGTILHMISWYDNSTGNKSNPDADNLITYGQRTIDEMGGAWISYYYLSDQEFKQQVEARKAKKTLAKTE